MTLRFTFRQLEYFVAVGELGTIALASGRLNVSSPSISTAISQLEADFKTKLFIRHHAQGLSLTTGGRRIFNEARQILHAAEGLNHLARDIRDKPGGPLTVGFLITIAPVLAADLRRSFEQAYPDAHITLRSVNQADLITMLNRAEIDIAVTYDIDLTKDIRFHSVAALPSKVVLSADHPLARHSSLTLAELATEPMILLDLPLSREFFLSHFRDKGLRPIIAERTNDLSVMQSLVANGYGYCLLNLQTNADTAPDGKSLVYVPLSDEHQPAVLGVASKSKDYKNTLQTAFEDHFQSRYSAGSLPGL